MQWLERIERRFAAAAGAGRGDRSVSVLRLGLERPRADPRLRPRWSRRRRTCSCTTCSAPARFSTAATSRSGATRSTQIGGFDRTIEFHGEDTNLGRRLTPLGRIAMCRRVLGLDVGAPLPGDGEAQGVRPLRAQLLVGDSAASAGRRRPPRREGLTCRATNRSCSATFTSTPRWSDGRLSVREVVDLYGQTGRFDVIAITDHILMKRDLLARAGRMLTLGQQALLGDGGALRRLPRRHRRARRERARSCTTCW